MTAEDALSLDEAVAQRVMGLVPCDGWVWQNLGSAGGPVLMATNCPHGHSPPECYPTKVALSVHGTIGGVPEYSTEMSQAWKVVERLTAQGYEFFLSMQNGKSDAEFGPGNPNENIGGDAICDTAPEAICRAALKVRGWNP